MVPEASALIRAFWGTLWTFLLALFFACAFLVAFIFAICLLSWLLFVLLVFFWFALLCACFLLVSQYLRIVASKFLHTCCPMPHLLS